ncbi:MAG: hypothetical protein HY807_02710 [Nitrospirae bacterium]|nr:hypothetical protein [Nitrospirota bacterium]
MIRPLVLAFAFLVLIGAGLSYAEGEKEYWNGPGWYMTCVWIDEDIIAGPYADDATCIGFLKSSDEWCDYYCVYVNDENLKDFVHYY